MTKQRNASWAKLGAAAAVLLTVAVALFLTAAVSTGLGRDPMQLCRDGSHPDFEQSMIEVADQGTYIEPSLVRATWSWFPLGVTCTWESPHEVIWDNPGGRVAAPAFFGSLLAGLLGLVSAGAALFRPGSARQSLGRPQEQRFG